MSSRNNGIDFQGVPLRFQGLPPCNLDQSASERRVAERKVSLLIPPFSLYTFPGTVPLNLKSERSGYFPFFLAS